MNTLKIQIPFEGFYNSAIDSMVDDYITSLFEGKPVRVYYDKELKRINAKIIEGHIYEPRF